ncbi:MAG: hypothetical protein K2X55_22800 [Burkholderiaceae bacterium]|nr:hypothetical protein [Burkholderiaceae bacterium]
MKRDDPHLDSQETSDPPTLGLASAAGNAASEARSVRTSTERGSAADKALLDSGGAIVSRLRLSPIAARALEILMEREAKAYGKQRAAIERALIEAAGGADLLEGQLAEEKAAAEAAEAAALAGRYRPRLSPIENELVALLERGPIVGTAEVGYRLWPNREMQPQGAACAANGILRRLLDRGFIESRQVEDRRSWSVTKVGRDAREQDRLDTIDPRQLTLLDSE